MIRFQNASVVYPDGTRALSNLTLEIPDGQMVVIVGLSGAGIDVPGDQKSRRDRLISGLIQRIGGNAVADKPAEYRVWAGSGLRWTLVRPPRLTEGPASGTVEHDAHRSPRSTKVRRSDLARFVVDVLEEDLYVGQAPFVAG